MRVIRDEIMCISNKDYEFREKLRTALEDWFNLEIDDIKEILRQLGVTDDEYEIICKSVEYDHINFEVITVNDIFEVELFRGNMISPYPDLKVYREDAEREIFCVDENGKVEKFL